jgi:hypothetical protein
MISLFQCLVNIAQVNSQLGSQITSGIGVREIHVIWLIVDNHWVIECVAWVKDSRHYFVLYLDETEGLFGNLLCFSSDGRYTIAHVAHFGVKAEGIQGARDGMTLTSRGTSHARYILIGQHSMDAGQSTGLAGVNATDTSVRIGAAQQFTDEHTSHFHISGEGRLALDQFHSVDFGLGFAYHAQAVPFRRDDHSRHRCDLQRHIPATDQLRSQLFG